MRRTCNPEKPVRVWHGAPLFACVAQPGKAQRGLSTRSIIERPLVRPQLPGPAFLRASEPVSCWPHKPCEWRSTRQPATSFQGSLPGRPLRSRRQSEKLDKHVRLVLLALSATVAEWLGRAIVDRSTRVRFSPVTPITGNEREGSVHASKHVNQVRL